MWRAVHLPACLLTARCTPHPALGLQLAADAEAERSQLTRRARTQQGLRHQADLGMHEAARELAGALQRESQLRVDSQVSPRRWQCSPWCMVQACRHTCSPRSLL